MLSLNLLIGLMFFRDLFSIVITSLLEERAGLYASRAFVCLSCMRFFFFFVVSLSCGIGRRLRMVIVALAGLFIYLWP